MFAVVAIAGLLLPGYAVGEEWKRIGDWSVYQRWDAFDDKIKVFALLGELPWSQVPATALRFECGSEGVLVGLIAESSFRGELTSLGTSTSVGIRIGKGKPIFEDWIASGKIAIPRNFWQGHSAFIKRLVEAKSRDLMIRIKLYGGTKTMKLNMSGIEKVLAEFKPICGEQK